MTERFHQIFEDIAVRQGEKIALTIDGRSASYRQILGYACAVAESLRHSGIPLGARVAIYSEMSVYAVAAAFGVLKAGGVLTCIRHTLSAEELELQLKDCGASAIIVSHSTAVRVSSNPQTVGVDLLSGELSEHIACFSIDCPQNATKTDLHDAATIFYTSGSTGESKGVLVTHTSMIAAFRSVCGYLDNNECDIVLSFSPGLSSDYGFYNTVMPLLFGGSAVVMTALPETAKSIVDIIEQYGVTALHVFPPALFRLCDSENLPVSRVRSLRYISTSGQALPQKYVRRLQQTLPNVLVFSNYGSTECKRISYLPPSELGRRAGSVGKAIPGVRTYLVDEFGALVVQPWQVGELAVAGELVMDRYWGRERATAEVLQVGHFGESRLFFTGDLFTMDEQGFLFFQCRKADLFERDGAQVNPRAIERVLVDHDQVAEALVVPVCDTSGSSVPKAYIVPDPHNKPNAVDLLSHCRRRLDPVAVPASIEFRRSLPRTFGGKASSQGLI